MELPAYGNYKLISIDIFDTLLLRTVAKATDLFIKTWDKAVEKGIAKSAISSKEYMKLRIEMERRGETGKPELDYVPGHQSVRGQKGGHNHVLCRSGSRAEGQERGGISDHTER